MLRMNAIIDRVEVFIEGWKERGFYSFSRSERGLLAG